MSKEPSKKEEPSPREQLWAEFVKNYKAANPVKAAIKEANGEFKAPPASFLGKRKTVRLRGGMMKEVIS